MSASVTFEDPTGRFAGQADLLARNVQAAFNMWAPYLAESPADLAIRFHLVTGYANRGGGASTASVAVGVEGDLVISDQGAGFELRTGIDPNGAAPDIEVMFDADYLASHYWINPLDGSTAPLGRMDLVQVIGHELGHALAFNGNRSAATGALVGGYASTFDRYVTFVNGAPFFAGPSAVAIYGGPVPLTGGNLLHLGAQGGGDALADDLMNGTGFVASHRYAVSLLDVAILSDCGVPTLLSDTLTGSAGADTINGGAGDDRIFGAAGDDHVFGGTGQNYLRGDQGDDVISGGDGFDDINGMMGDDIAHGNGGNDWVVGGKDNDGLSGDDGDDVVFGNLGDDTCSGGTGADIVRGGQGDDVIDGGPGNDWLSGDRGDDIVSGGAGADIFHTFGEAGLDRVIDFNVAEGDRVMLDPGTTYAFAQVGADTVISLDQGARMVLVGVQLSTLPTDWIFVA